MSDLSGPIIIETKSMQENAPFDSQTLATFDSYSFSRDILVPASAFRFTAPGVDKTTRLNIRSGDQVSLYCASSKGVKIPVAVGIIDETDTHLQPERVEYVLSGRDLLSQLVDNSAIDSNNKVIYLESVTLEAIVDTLIRNTRIPPEFFTQQIPTGTLLFQTTPGESKINSLQRYLEFMNCLVWTLGNGQLVIGKPDFTQDISGKLIMNYSDPSKNNVLEARVRRNVNQAISQIVVQLQTQGGVDAGAYAHSNNIDDFSLDLKDGSGVGKSLYVPFTYGQGSDAVNLIKAIGNTSASPNVIGAALANREIARSNMQVLDVEVVRQGHLNENDDIYDIDQIYNVQIEDENISIDMYVYAVEYELTLQHGRLTRIKLCSEGTIVDSADILPRAQ